MNCKYTHPFTDVDWADRYEAYAYHTGITNGISKDKFDSKIGYLVWITTMICLKTLTELS